MLRNIGSNWALAFIQLVVMLCLTPIQISTLGADAQGMWLLVASLTATLGLLILGVPMASVRFLAGHVARNEIDQANEVIATCLGVCLGLGAAALVVAGGLSIFFEHTYLDSERWRALGPDLIHQARVAFWISVVQVCFGFASQLPFGILDAHEAFVARNGVKIAGLLLRLVMIAGLLRLYPSLILIAVSQLAIMVVEFIVSMVIIRRHWPGLRFGLRGFDRARLRTILGFSLFAMLLNAGSMLSFQTDQLVINAYRGPEQGTYFDVGNKFFPVLLGLVLGIGVVMMPRATKLQATGSWDELRADFLKWSKVAYSLALLVGVYLMVLAPEFIAWWVGPELAQPFAMPAGRVTRVLMFSFLFFLPVRGVASPMLMGLGKPALPALAFLGMGIINLIISLLLVKPLGIFGVAVGTAIPCVLFALLVAWLACRAVGTPILTYLDYVMLRPSLGVIPPLALLVVIKREMHVFNIHASRTVEFVPLFVAGVGMVAVFLVVWALFVYRDDPYVDFNAALLRYFPILARRKVP